MHVDDRIFSVGFNLGRDAARLIRVTAPTVEAITVDELREYARVDSKAEARTMGLIAKAAREYYEKITGLALLQQTWRLELDRAPLGTTIDLPRAPLLAVAAGDDPAVVVNGITYIDSAGATRTISSDDYVAPRAGVAGAFVPLALDPDASWPDLGSYPGALRIEFNAGFGTTAETVPEEIRLAVLMLAAWWYESRLPINIGNIVNPLPTHLDSLIEMHRVAFVA